MASLSSVGLGSGLDVNSIVTQLVQLEKSRLTPLETTSSLISSRISAVSKVKSLTATLQDKLQVLSDSSKWTSATKVTSSNATGVSATTNDNAVAGSYSIKINQMAAAESVTSGSYALDKKWNSQNLTITVAGKNVDVEIEEDASISDVARAINNANAGVTASVMHDGQGQRLVISSKTTGVDNAFRITSSITGSDLIHSGAANQGLSAGGFYKEAENAKATVNGVEVTSATNTFANTIQGVSFTALQQGAETSLEVAPDTEKLKTQIQDFVTAFNALNDYLSTSTKYDDASKTAGVFQADSTMLSLQNSLRNAVRGSISSMEGVDFERLSDLGIQMEKGGNLSVNPSKLSAVLDNNMREVSRFFSEGNSGFADGLYSYTKKILSFDGILESKAESLQKASNRNKDEIDKVNQRATSVEKRLLEQYSALDTKMASLNALSSYVSQQVTAWNNSNN